MKNPKKMKTVSNLSEDLVEKILVRLPIQSISPFQSVSKTWRNSIRSLFFAGRYLGGSINIIEAILVRLPVKSLARFQCVSKPWCRLIRSHRFHRNHHGANLKIMATCSKKGNPRLVSYDMTGDVNADAIKFPFDYGYDQRLCNSCNGLFLVMDYSDHSLNAYNPLTNVWKKIPEAPNDECLNGIWFVHCGIGYDQITGGYKVLQFEWEWDDNEDGHVEVRVYTLRTNSWRRFGDIPYRPCETRQTMTQVSNALYLFVKRSSGFDDSDLIVAFDLGTEDFREVPQPDYRGGRVFQTYLFGSDSSLCVAAVLGNPRETHIWKMEQYGGGKESWKKLITIPVERVYAVHLSFKDQLALHFYEDGVSKLRLYCLRRKIVTKSFEVRSVLQQCSSIQVYVENPLIRL